MKLFSFLFFYAIPSSLLLCAALCCPEEDDLVYNDIFIKNDNLIVIVNNEDTFNLDDIIFIECSIEDSQVTTNNQNIKLSDYFYQDLPENIVLRYGMTLYKGSSFGELMTIPINNEFIELIEGEVDSNTDNPYLAITNTFDGSNFKSKFGIKLKETGVFYLSNTQASNDGIIRIYGGDYNLGNIEISTKIINSDASGLYKFTVE